MTSMSNIVKTSKRFSPTGHHGHVNRISHPSTFVPGVNLHTKPLDNEKICQCCLPSSLPIVVLVTGEDNIVRVIILD